MRTPIWKIRLTAIGALFLMSGIWIHASNSSWSAVSPQLVATPKPALAVGKTTKPPAETVVKSLYDSLTPGQREKVALPWSHPNRARVEANWAIVDETVGDFFNADQQAMIAEIPEKKSAMPAGPGGHGPDMDY